MSVRCLLLSTLAFGCGGDPHQTTPDAGACWPLTSTPGGSVALGTGDLTFTPMPDTLAVTRNGSQSDPYLPILARMAGLAPGDPHDALDPTNPHTKITGVIADLGLTLGVECPASIGYVAANGVADTFDLAHALRIGLGTTTLASVDGKTIDITVEVVSGGLYAKDEKLVTLTVPN